MAYRHTIEELERVLGRRFDVLHVVGGGGRNRLLNRMTADAVGRRVIVGPHEATSAGNVLVQAMGAGEIASPDELRRIACEAFDTEVVDPTETAAWDARYLRFLELCGR
jgi:rhamnulokinase